MSDIFISYAGDDRAVATQIAEGLQGAGVRVWLDQKDIGLGENWIQTLEDTLSQCTAFIILIGPSGVRKWVKFELALAMKRHIEQELPIFPLLLSGVTPEALPPFLATLQAQALPQNLSDLDYGRLAQALSQRGCSQPRIYTPPVPSDICPFPGLEAFGENDAKFFFGRQREILKAVSHLGSGLDGRYRRWLHIEGTSGVGKSSLVRAGIIPTIKQGWAGSTEGSTWQRWQVVEPMRPGEDPILNLAQALCNSLNQEHRPLDVGKVHGALQKDDMALKVQMRGWVPEKQALVLVVDQLEELFTLTKDDKRRAHFDALLANALTDLDGPLHLITTIRTDFMMQFNAVPCLQALLDEKAARYFLTPIDDYGLKDVVQTPAKLAGLTWSDEELPKDIVQEATGEPGALPLVENLLRLLWDESQKRKDHTLHREVYNSLGGVGGALATSADGLLESLGEAGKHQALQLLIALVNVGSATQDMQDTRRTITKASAIDAAGGGQEAEEILNQLSGLRGRDTAGGAPARPRLVVVSKRSDNGTEPELVDLAHETLLRYNRHKKPFWSTLRKEIDLRRRNIENRQLADAMAKEWRANGSSRWRGLANRTHIKAFRHLSGLSDNAQDYVKASNRLAKIRTWSMVLILLIFSVVTASAALVGWANSKGLDTSGAAKVLLTRVGIDLLSPAMVEVKAGTFTMRDWMGDGPTFEFPIHAVNIERDFKLGKYEVTFEEYELFVKLTGKGILKDEGWGRGQRPAINVSWDDAKAYVQWLSEETGQPYRLPTEAEWEYAARSGGKNEVWAGTSDEQQLASYAIFSADRTEPVGEQEGRKPNGLGLYDMSGNVSEWVEDCWWYRKYEGKPSNGSAWLEAGGGDCGLRVIRGGSWGDFPWMLRSSARIEYFPDEQGIFRLGFLGFRLAQDTP